jgi:hypothetical protein
MTTIVISLSLWVVTALSYVIFNLYNKNKKMESMILNQNSVIKDFMMSSKVFSDLVNKIDITMWVQSDPELLEVFETIKQLKSTLDRYDETKY